MKVILIGIMISMKDINNKIPEILSVDILKETPFC